ncbi:unnamed protein product [Ambrosiozyma monospora]|uniref:holo-[acyl-carrier-protein] synthase n=1 Tax=Ambrosiozyma monospora TaxID=43982 RepID=A0A9W6Z1L4_AMBMO|nr:unnamed protein product [Ambrosiozyma monospora]
MSTKDLINICYDSFDATLSQSDSTLFFYIEITQEVEDLLADDFTWELAMRNIPLKQQLAINNLRFQSDRIIKLLNALILPFIINCKSKTKFTARDLAYGHGKFGKPFLVGPSCVMQTKISFNLSDEDGVIGLFVQFDCSDEVGLDLANWKDIENFVDLGKSDVSQFYQIDFRDIFSDVEVLELDETMSGMGETLEPKLKLLSQYWALKESYSKFLGVGLNQGLQNYQFLNISPLLENLSIKLNLIRKQVRWKL